MSGTTTPAGWYPDPSGRHELRYWTGADWSDQIANGGVVSSESAAPAAPVAAAAVAQPAATVPTSDPFAGYQQAPADPFAGYQQAPADPFAGYQQAPTDPFAGYQQAPADPFAGYQQAPTDPFAGYQQAPQAMPTQPAAPSADPLFGGGPQGLSPFGSQAPGQGFAGGLPPVAPPIQVDTPPIDSGSGRAPIPRRTLILAAVLAVVVVAGAAMFLLGGDEPVSTEGVTEPGLSVNDPAAPTTVPGADPAAPTSTPVEGSAATDEGAATEGAAGVYPQQVIDNFVSACSTGQSVEGCECAIANIQNTYSLEQFSTLEQEYVATGVFPQQMVALIEPCFA